MRWGRFGSGCLDTMKYKCLAIPQIEYDRFVLPTELQIRLSVGKSEVKLSIVPAQDRGAVTGTVL